MYEYIYTYICVYVYTIICMCIHTHTHTHTYTWSDNKVHEIIAVKVLHTSLPNATVFAFEVLPLGS